MTRSLKRLGWAAAFWRYLRDPEASVLGKLLGVLAVAYVVMPVDLVPDVVPVVGWLDDVGVVGLVGAWLARRVAQYRTTDDRTSLRSRRPFSVMP